MDRLAQLLRLGATPVLSEFGFRKDRHNYGRLAESGDLMVVSFDNGGTAPVGAAAEVAVGYFPRYSLRKINSYKGDPAKPPHASMAMIGWRLVAPFEFSYAPERGEPYASWWALGDRTEDSASALSACLRDVAIPRLMEFMDPQVQYAAVESNSASPRVLQMNQDLARVMVRLGHSPRGEITARLAEIPLDGFFGQRNGKFVDWVNAQLDDIYDSR